MSLVLGRLCVSYRSCLWRSLSGCQEALDRFCCPGRQGASLHTSIVASAGHNKWSKVKHIKGPKDAARARLFAKLSMMIKVAVREGGPHPDFNPQLYQLIEQGRQRNMPKVSIEAAIKGADKSKPTSYALLQARGPGGCSLIIELLTDNTSRSFADLRLLLNKNGGTPTDALHCFNKKGVVTTQTQDRDGKPVQMEQALDLAIQSGAEDVQEFQDEEEETDVYKYICDLSSLRDVRSQLISLGLVPISSGLEYLPITTVELSDADKERVFKLLELIKDQPDVMRIYDNIE
ncbi:translational activator of cytochrome c oxidase 1 [Hyla sarda]|uniref:translational activator of cytochrome c oxidase 1 n=1 Tax=Hyla sarda TaxID=327740 RepID=UPI0024C35840|nr:translational activator of cytochrome c oxidase 1 [Hyla sarda]XP_056404267.1 translational activator of cytochrome c oxidase 1 [Hyla sarda]XP_056404268.1 translational activator of cytochrome c oxidase 1 [Hyla sarda]